MEETYSRLSPMIREDSDNLGLGAVTMAVCDAVCTEFHRRSASAYKSPISTDLQSVARGKVLSELSPRDRVILRLVLFSDKQPEQICRELKIDQDYVRVLLFRIKKKIEESYLKSSVEGDVFREVIISRRDEEM